MLERARRPRCERIVFSTSFRAIVARRQRKSEVRVQVPGLLGKSMVKIMALRQQRKGSVPVMTRMRLASYQPLTKLTPMAWRARGVVEHDSCDEKTLTRQVIAACHFSQDRQALATCSPP